MAVHSPVSSRRTMFLGALSCAALPHVAWARSSTPTVWRADDMVLGAANARHGLIEYASVTCAHCREFHKTVMPMLKAEFIDVGKLRYAMRALPTPPHALAILGFNMARIGAADATEYYRRIGLLFESQRGMFEAAQQGNLQSYYEDLGQKFGLSPQQFKQSVEDEAMIASVQAIAQEGASRFNITATPTLILNDARLDGPGAGWTAETLRAALNEKIGRR